MHIDFPDSCQLPIMLWVIQKSPKYSGNDVWSKSLEPSWAFSIERTTCGISWTYWKIWDALSVEELAWVPFLTKNCLVVPRGRIVNIEFVLKRRDNDAPRTCLHIAPQAGLSCSDFCWSINRNLAVLWYFNNDSDVRSFCQQGYNQGFFLNDCCCTMNMRQYLLTQMLDFCSNCETWNFL